MALKLSDTTQVVLSTYNPNIPLLGRNLDSILKQFKDVLVVDDFSKNRDDIRKLLERYKIDTIYLPKNMGIAHSQNVGLKEAVKKKKTWLLTMDQDSVLPDTFSTEYERIINSYDNIGLVAWNQRPYKLGTSDEVEKDWYIISSGCLNNVKAVKECGGFDDQLVIDHVDTDINIRIRNLGYKTITTNNVKLIHEIGKATDKRTIRGYVYHEHSPMRVYYIVRNGIVLFRRYFFKQPKWMLKALINSFREGMYLIYYQPNKIKNSMIVMRAWWDGIFNRLGKYRN
jgi:rhamnosyltransferase